MTVHSHNPSFRGRMKSWAVLAASGLISIMFASPVVSQTLPNAAKTCLASSSSVPFSAWFSGGNPTVLNAAVTAANSVTFTNNPALANADFYQWSYRMFLWLTSPSPSTYGGTGLVMSSPEFYNLSAPDSSGDQTLIQNESRPIFRPGVPIPQPKPLRLALRVANLGPHNLPIIKDKQGRYFEVAPLKLAPNGKPLILNSANKEVELSHVVRTAAGKIEFIGTDGKAIASPKLQPHARAERLLGIKSEEFLRQPQANIVFKLSGSLLHGPFRGPIFILPGGVVINAAPGDADGNVQMTQAGSLIYYSETVNDVYAYFVTQINPVVTHASATFPTDAPSLAPITAFATLHGHTFLNPNALAIEIKAAWVDASTLSNPNDYITMMAMVPTYNKTTATNWVENGTATIKVALVGMHVVGSVNGHPEMIWSTFEHFGNTPNVSYAFNDSGGNPQTQPADPIGGSAKWLFCGATAPPLSFTAGAGAGSATTITSNISPTGVQGTSALRLAPFGAPNNQTPNPLINSVAASNTQIISINNDVHSQMNAGDVRSQYFFEGATWTELGAAPTSNFPDGNVVGTSHLANSTLETFTQSAVFVKGGFPGPGCLSGCHLSNTTNVSHIFSGIKALF